MAHVVCLIADPERTPLDRVMVATLERTLGGTARWLAPDDRKLPVDHHDPAEIRGRLEATLPPELPHDVVVLPAACRRKRLLVSDMDPTMITVECIDELAAYLGIKPGVSSITRRAMDGELDFVAALRARLRAAGLGVAFRPTPRVVQLAPVIIRWGDLTALPYLQGIPRSDFVAE